MRRPPIAILGVLVGFILLGAGCAAAQRPAPILIAPSCEPDNVFERCKLECGKDHKQAAAAWENAERYRCYCVNFDAYRLPPPWREPGPRPAQRRLASGH